jgi:integrase
MSRRRYQKPLASFEYGTRLYAPSPGEPRFRVISRDTDGNRVFRRFSDEDTARCYAREVEAMLVSSVMMPGRLGAPATVGQLIDRYLASLGARSTRYVERQEYLLRMWVRPVLDDVALRAWTPSDSEQVLDRARRTLAPATVQNVGAAMRALVTFALKNRWLSPDADPMWLVRYSAKAEHQGQAVGFIPRSALPTDDQCEQLFATLADQGHPSWALATRLKHRCGARWGELIALRPLDISFEPQRVVRIHRSVEQSRRGIAVKPTKNHQQRISVFPASLVDDLRAWCEHVTTARGPEGLLFAGGSGGYANRRTFQRIWARAARDAGWPMRSSTSALWHPHDLRHVAACWLLFDVGLDPAAVATLLGHANPAFTLSRYVGVRGDLASVATAATGNW